MEDQDRRLREIKGEIVKVGEVLLWAEDEIKRSISEDSHDRQIELYLGSILDIDKSVQTTLLTISTDVRSLVSTAQEELRAFSASQAVTVDLIRSSVDETASRIETAVTRVSEPSLSPAAQAAAAIQHPSTTGLSAENDKKLGLVLDSAAGFLESWSDPVMVGSALAIPVVGGIAALLGGAYLIIGKLLDPVIHAIDGISGAISSWSPSGGTKATKVEHGEEVARALSASVDMIAPPLTSMDATLVAIAGKMDGISEQITARAGSQSAIDLTPIAETIESAIARGFSMISVPSPVVTPVQGARPAQAVSPFRPDAEDKILELLSAPIRVAVVSSVQDSSSPREDTATVFAAAVRPLVAGQAELTKTLDSSMRRLSEAVASLREAPQPGAQNRTSRVNDTVNTTLSETSETLILTETKLIREALTGFREDFTAFRALWAERGSRRSREESVEPTELSGD